MPLSTAGICLFETTPPTMASTNSYPSPRFFGATLIATSPNCPAPPDCFLWRYLISALPLIVSQNVYCLNEYLSALLPRQYRLLQHAFVLCDSCRTSKIAAPCAQACCWIHSPDLAPVSSRRDTPGKKKDRQDAARSRF